MSFLPSTKTENGDTMSEAMIAPHLPLVDVSGNILIFSDGSLGAGFSCTAPISGLLPEDSRFELYDSLRAALNLLPPDASVQVVFGQEARYEETAALLNAGDIKNRLVSLAVEGRTKRQLAALQNGQLRVTTLDIYITVPSVVSKKNLAKRVGQLEKTVSSQGRSKGTGVAGWVLENLVYPVQDVMDSMLKPLKGSVVFTYQEYQETRVNLVTAAEGFQEALYSANLHPKPMDADTLLKRYYRKWNPSKFESGLVPRPYTTDTAYPVTETFLSSPFDWDPSGKRVPKGMFYLDGYYHQIVTMVMPPEMMFFPHLENSAMYGGMQRMEVIVNLSACSVAERIKALQDEEKAILNNNKGDTAVTKLQQIQIELKELGDQEEKLWQAQHLFILRSADPEALKRDVRSLLTMAKRDGSTDLSEEIHALFRYWMASQPGYSRDQDMHRHNKYNTRQLVAMLPVFGGSRIPTDKRIGAVFETNDGSLHNVFLHEKSEMNSPNALVLGTSGSGKSVLVNAIVTQLSRHNPRVVLVDIGSSYKKLCESLGGTFLEYDIRTSDCRINPFDVYEDGVADPDRLQSSMLLLEKMAFDPKCGPTLSNHERTAFEDALGTLIRKNEGKTFFLSDLRETLLSQSTEVSKSLATRIAPFCKGGGVYANLFDGPTNAPRGNRFTVFELAKVRHSSAELLPIVFQVVLQHTISLANNYADDMKLLGMDEAHVLLEDPQLRKFVELAYRTFRKLDVAVLGISQGIDDWVLPGEKHRAILDNVSALFICNQKDAGAQRITDLMGLSPNEHAALRGLKTSAGEFADFMVVTFGAKGRKTSVCTNRLSSIEYAMFTSSGDDNRIINRWNAKGQPLSDCIVQFSEKYPRGVERAGGPRPEDKAAA